MQSEGANDDARDVCDGAKIKHFFARMRRRGDYDLLVNFGARQIFALNINYGFYVQEKSESIGVGQGVHASDLKIIFW